MRDGQPANGRHIEMIVVIVRDDHDVHRRQILECQRGRREPLRARERERARALRPLRIREDVHAVELNQQRGMADPGHGRLGPVLAQRAAVARDARERGRTRREGRRHHARREEADPRPEPGPRLAGCRIDEAVLAMVRGSARLRPAHAGASTKQRDRDEQRRDGRAARTEQHRARAISYRAGARCRRRHRPRAGSRPTDGPRARSRCRTRRRGRARSPRPGASL